MAETTEKKVVEQSYYTPQDFMKQYEELCEKTGYSLVITPAWVSTNHGTYETKLQVAVGKLPKKEGGDSNE